MKIDAKIPIWVEFDSRCAFDTEMMSKNYFARLCFAVKKEARKGWTVSSSQEEESTFEFLKESRVLSKGQCKVSKSSLERDVLA